MPINSKLIAQSPSEGKFIDDESAAATQTAAWDVTLGEGKSRAFSYTYHYPYNLNNVSTQKVSANIKTENNTKSTTAVPTKNTGIPIGLLVVGALAAAGGVGYSKFKK